MIKLFVIVLLLFSLAVPVSALEMLPPDAPESAAGLMPEENASFANGLWEIIRKAIQQLFPAWEEAEGVCASVIAVVLILGVINCVAGRTKRIHCVSGTVVIASIMVSSANTMMALGTSTIRELRDYGKLLFPVMTAAMAAQGGFTSSAALYTGTVVFDYVLSAVFTELLIPLTCLFLALAVANSAVGEDILKKARDLIKNGINWMLKLVLTVFTTYMSITGVVSGTTDAAALKATKLTISSVVPVIGGILSDASESILLSAGIMKNSAGIYGIFALTAILIGPFLRISIQYLMLKATATISSLVAPKEITGLIEDFSTAMGFLLAMTGACCLIMLISTVCFMKGVG